MSNPNVPPMDLDLSEIDAGDLARLFVSRACSDSTMAWAEIGYDAMRYPKRDELAVHLAGFVEQLLAAIGAAEGLTSAQVWQRMMLEEAERRR